MTYETDGQCDHINTSDCSRCLRTAMWLHLPSGLCYCNLHTKVYSEVANITHPEQERYVEQQWEPL